MKYNIESEIKKITEPWKPIDLAVLDGKVLRLALFEGEYREHVHEFDEFFSVHSGAITIWTEKGSIYLNAGEGTIIRKGVRHKPISKGPSYVLMIDSV